MQAARRLYLYVMSGVTLGVVAYGLVLLLRVVLDGIFPAAPYGGIGNSRQELSQAIAMLGVGAPVWAIHWWLAQRGARRDGPGAAAERGSAIRAAYFTLVLLVSLSVWFFSALSFGRWLVSELSTAEDAYGDPLGSATLAVVAFTVWLYHGLARRRDMAAGPVTDAAAWLPRLYLYGVVVVALFVAANTLSGLIPALILPIDSEFEGFYDTTYLVEQAASAAAWGALWLGHWLYANRLLAHRGWRGPEERAARVRVAAFFVVIVGAASSTLRGVADALQAAIQPMLPAAEARADSVPLRILTTVAAAAVFALIWWWHDRRFRREPAASEPLRALHQVRLESYGLSGVGLALGAPAVGWLLGLGLDLLFGGARGRTDSLQYSTHELGNWLSLAAVAVPAWAWFWRAVLARRRVDRVDEAGSTIRRTYLFLTLAVAVLAGLAAAAVILYRLVGVVIGAPLGGNVVSELSTPTGALLAAVVVALYHGLALRNDQRVTAEARAALSPEPAAGAGAAPEGAATIEGAGESEGMVRERARRSVVLVGPAAADFDAALATVRAALPEGFEIVEGDL